MNSNEDRDTWVKALKLRLTWENRKAYLEVLGHLDCVRFALFCAKSVEYLSDNPTVGAANAAVGRFLEGKATAKQCKEAAIATYAFDDAGYASYAAIAAVSAVGYGRDLKEDAASHASYASAVSVVAVYDLNGVAAKEAMKQDQITYLRELVVAALPEDLKECWLVAASL